MSTFSPARQALIDLVQKQMKAEGDRREFEAEGYHCLILRLTHGNRPTLALHTYVGVPPSHPFYRKEFNEALCGHTGCELHQPSEFVSCDTAMKVEKQFGGRDDCWYFTFAFDHAWDIVPRYLFDPEESYPFPDSKYRGMDEAEEWARKLAFQLKEVEVNGWEKKP